MMINAPAKINLYLKVLSRRNDGYHEIETLFERVSLFDRLSVEFSRDRTVITCDDPAVPTNGDSLMGRAVSAFTRRTGTKKYFNINLEKHIPVSAGLGGGSSDAAALLKGMNELEGRPLDENALIDIGRGLGSDIPFFLDDSRFACGKGRGDIIEKVETSLEIWHVLVNPPFGIPTKEVYGKFPAFSLTKNRPVDTISPAFLYNNNYEDITENLHNDLQHIVLRDFPTLEQVFSELKKAGAEGALLSGSGPTVFGIFAPATAEMAGEKLRKIFPEADGWKVFVVRTC
jgi:4-diphosphocytidyl-2-C-methyl-D-erythritol kinase